MRTTKGHMLKQCPLRRLVPQVGGRVAAWGRSTGNGLYIHREPAASTALVHKTLQILQQSV